MSSPTLGLLACVVGASIVAANAGAQSSSTDDRRVLLAVLEHTIRGEHKSRPAPLNVLAQSVPICAGAHVASCLPRQSAELIRLDELPRETGFNSSATPQPVEVIPDRTVRDDLVASLAARNAEPHALSLGDISNVIFVPQPNWEQQTLSERDTSVYAGFSLPGYSREGHALVYAFYSCGARCGSGWLFLLDQHTGAWQVRARYTLWLR